MGIFVACLLRSDYHAITMGRQKQATPQHRVYRSRSTTESPLNWTSPPRPGHIEEHGAEKNEKLAAESGKAGFGLRRHGRTQGRARAWYYHRRAHKEFFTPDYYWTIIDAPGRDFVKNMITQAQADTAVLLCAANDGVNAQTKEHASSARCSVSRASSSTSTRWILVELTEEKYNNACKEVSQLLRMAGFKQTTPQFLLRPSTATTCTTSPTSAHGTRVQPLRGHQRHPNAIQAIRQASPLAHSGCPRSPVSVPCLLVRSKPVS